MSKLQLSPLLSMTLPVALIILLPRLPRDQVAELKRQMPGVWYSADKAESLSINNSTSGTCVSMFTHQSRAQIEANLSVVAVRMDAADVFHFVDGSHLHIDRGHTWAPGASVRVSINGDSMLLDPSDGKDASKTTRWIRVHEK